MAELLERTNRMNMLFAFYGSLLTDKQQSILELYYHDNFSLGEIAADMNVSRQAVYEHLKRAEVSLEEYETKLKLASQYAARRELTDQLEVMLRQLQSPHQLPMLKVLAQLQDMDDPKEAE